MNLDFILEMDNGLKIECSSYYTTPLPFNVANNFIEQNPVYTTEFNGQYWAVDELVHDGKKLTGRLKSTGIDDRGQLFKIEASIRPGYFQRLTKHVVTETRTRVVWK